MCAVFSTGAASAEVPAIDPRAVEGQDQVATAVYSPDPADSWNRIFELAFAAPTEWHVPVTRDEIEPPAQLRDQTPDERRRAVHDFLEARFNSARKSVVRNHAGDRPDFFFFGRVDPLVEEPRFGALTAALSSELTEPTMEGRSTLARVLFQQDLWQRFLALRRWLDDPEDPIDRLRVERGESLLDLLGRLMAAVACPHDELTSNISSNFAHIAASHALVDADLFAKDSAWSELVPIVRGSPYMSHTVTAGGRRVFRSFLKIPGPGGRGACVDAGLNHWRRPPTGAPDASGCPEWTGQLPEDTELVLMETPVALTDKGERVILPLVLSLEMRQVRLPTAGEDGQFGLDDLPFLVLHGSRRFFIDGQAARIGLPAMAPDEPVPPSLAAFTVTGRSGGALLPLHLACTRCHLIDGSGLMTGSVHSLDYIRVLHPNNTLQQEAAGSGRPVPEQLRKYFQPPAVWP